MNDVVVIQECENCHNMWANNKVDTRCPECGDYRIIVEAEWDEVDDDE